MKRKSSPVAILAAFFMLATVFALPVVNDSYSVDAAVKKYKVTYYKNGGKFTSKKYAKKSSVTKKIRKNKKLGTTLKVKRTGYTFKGWFNKKSGGKKYTKNTRIKKTTRLYARWSANKYTVTFRGGQGIVTPPRPLTVTFGKAYGTLPKPKMQDGWEFLYWVDTANNYERVYPDTKYKHAKNTEFAPLVKDLVNEN